MKRKINLLAYVMSSVQPSGSFEISINAVLDTRPYSDSTQSQSGYKLLRGKTSLLFF